MNAFISTTWKFFALILVGIAPFMLIAGIVGWRDIIKIAVYGFFVALLATVPNGTRIGVQLALIFSLLAGMGTLLQDSTLGITILMGVSAALIPIYGYRGMLQAGIFAAMFLPNTVNPPPHPWAGADPTSLAFFAAIVGLTLLGSIWGIVIGGAVHRALPESPQTPRSQVSPRAAWVAGVLIVAVTCTITYVSVTNFPQAKWAWLLGAIYSMMMASTGMTWTTTWQIIAGTMAGALAAIVLLFANPPVSVMMMAGAIVMSASIALKMIGKPYWSSTGISTAGVIVLTGSSMDPLLAAEDRVIFTFVGALVAVVLGASLTVIFRWEERRTATA